MFGLLANVYDIFNSGLWGTVKIISAFLLQWNTVKVPNGVGGSASGVSVSFYRRC
jgi:hypothetical protein